MFISILLTGILLLQSLSVDWVDDTHYDFGEISYGIPVIYDFPFKNTGTEALIIDNVRASCGCTAIEWTQEPVLPDSMGYITVDYDAKDRGYFQKKIKVYFKGIRGAEKLTIEGEVID